MATVQNTSGAALEIYAQWNEGTEVRYASLTLASLASGTIPDEALMVPAISDALDNGDLVISVHGTGLGDYIPRVAIVSGTFNCTAGTSTTVADTAMTATSTVIVTAQNIYASQLVMSANGVYVGSEDISANTHFRVHHTSGADGRENFWYTILG